MLKSLVKPFCEGALLGIEVDDQDPMSFLRRGYGETSGDGRLSNSALGAKNQNGLRACLSGAVWLIPI